MKSDESGKEVFAEESLTDQYLVKRINQIEEKIARENRSWLRRSSALIGILALFISSATGIFTIWEKVIIEPSLTYEKDIEKVRSTIRRLLEIKREVAYLSGLGDAYVAPQTGTVYSDLEIELQKVDVLIRDLNYNFNFKEYEILGESYQVIGDNESARYYFERALNVARDKLRQAQALTLLGITLFSPGNTQDLKTAREKFSKSVELLNGVRNKLAIGVRFMSYLGWIHSEMAYGDCDRARTLFNEAKTNVPLKDNSETKIRFMSTMLEWKKTENLTCHYEWHW